MNKKSIIKVVVMFIVIVAFMKLAGMVLGKENAIMGMLIVLSTLMLLGKDLTATPFKNFIKLACIGIINVVCAYLSALNPFLSIVVNGIWVFILIFTTTFNLKKPMYIGFLITYLMLLTFHTTVNEIIPRSLALVFGAFLVIVIQLIIRATKMKKSKYPNITKSINSLVSEIANIVDKKDFKKEQKAFRDSIKTWNSSILERKENNFYFTHSENRQIGLIVLLEILEKQVLEINELYLKDEEYKNILLDISEMLRIFSKELVEGEDIKVLEQKLGEIAESNKELSNNYYVSGALKSLTDLIKGFKEKGLDIEEEVNIITEKPSLFKILKHSFRRDSLRFTFAIRMSILVTVIYFIVAYFNIPNGKWILFTIMSVAQPYVENTKKAGIGRIYGTIIGAVIFFVLFALLPNVPIRMGILAIGFFVMLNAKNPIYKAAGITVFSLGMAAISIMGIKNEETLIMYRVGYTILGYILAYLAGMFIFKYNLNIETKSLINRYYDISRNNIKSIMEAKDLNNIIHKINSSLLITKSMENKIMINNTALKNEEIDNFIEYTREFTVNMYIALERVNSLGSDEDLEHIKGRLKDIYKDIYNIPERSIKDRLKENFDLNKRRIAYISLAELIESMIDINNSKKKIDEAFA